MSIQCLYFVQLRCEYCPDIIQKSHKCCPNTDQILWRYCSEFGQILTTYCPDIARVLLTYCPDIFKEKCQNMIQIFGIVQILLKHWLYIPQIVYGFWLNFVKHCKNIGQILSKCLLDIDLLLSKHFLRLCLHIHTQLCLLALFS